jgi:hypothetical protein
MLSEYTRTFDDRLNLPLINRELDKELYIYVYETIKSLEVFDSVKILGYTYNDKENDIKMQEYQRTRMSGGNKEKEDPVQIMPIVESRVGELIIHYELSIDEVQEDKTTKVRTKRYSKKILIPLKDEEGYYTIRGNRYILMYQLVDSTTYSTSNSVVLKSIMPIPLKRKIKYVHDVDRNQFTVPIYSTMIFKNEINMMLLFFAKMGFLESLKYFSVDRVITMVEELGDDLDYYVYFKINQNLFIRVNRYAFNESMEVKSIVGMMMECMNNRTLLFDVVNQNFWLEKLGYQPNTQQPKFKRDRARNLLLSADRMIDMTTRRVLNIAPDHKDSMYSALRWMFMNYNELKNKQTMDITNKRLRDNEYIASLMTSELSSRLYRVMSAVRRPQSRNLNTVEELFSFKGNILLENLFLSGLFKYDDVVNDMDFWSKLKFTIKGPNSQGNASSGKTIATCQRGIDPSFIGRIDLNVVGNSDPGATGILTPFIKTDGLNISDKNEPENGQFKLLQIIEEAVKNENYYVENFGIETEEQYADLIEKIYTTTTGCDLSIKKEYIVEEGNNE